MKITSEATIKKAAVLPACGDIDFAGFDFTSDQYRQIAKWVKEKTRLKITIEAKQGECLMMISPKKNRTAGFHIIPKF